MFQERVDRNRWSQHQPGEERFYRYELAVFLVVAELLERLLDVVCVYVIYAIYLRVRIVRRHVVRI